MIQLCVCIVVLVTQLCLTLCDPVDCNPPGSLVQGILWARILEWVVIPFSRGSPQSRIEHGSPVLQADSLLFGPSGKLCVDVCVYTLTHMYICVYIYIYMCVCVCVCCAVLSCLVMSDSLQPHGLQPTRLFCP